MQIVGQSVTKHAQLVGSLGQRNLILTYDKRIKDLEGLKVERLETIA